MKKRIEYRRKNIVQIKRILPYLEAVDVGLFSICAFLRPNRDDDNQYAIGYMKLNRN